MTATDYEVIDTETGEVMQNGSTALATRRPAQQVANREMVGGLLRPVAAPADVLVAQNEIRALIAQTLQKDRDYGVIPGTQKPTLYKPGAERINAAYGIAAEYIVAEKEIDHDRPVSFVKRTWEWGERRGQKVWSETPGQSEGLYRYVVECRLIHRASGAIVGQGIGSCSTMESKYIDRPRDLENTVLKMASKRAYIAATLNTHGLSDQFTQDIEDNPEAHGLGKEQAPERSKQEVGPIADQPLGFGKYGTKTWAEVLKDNANYFNWASENARKLSPAEKDELRAMRNPVPTDDGPPAFDDVPDSIYDDEPPF